MLTHFAIANGGAGLFPRAFPSTTLTTKLPGVLYAPHTDLALQRYDGPATRIARRDNNPANVLIAASQLRITEGHDDKDIAGVSGGEDLAAPRPETYEFCANVRLKGAQFYEARANIADYVAGYIKGRIPRLLIKKCMSTMSNVSSAPRQILRTQQLTMD